MKCSPVQRYTTTVNPRDSLEVNFREPCCRMDSLACDSGDCPRTAPAAPTTVRWNLRLGVSDVDGELKISQLESLR